MFKGVIFSGQQNIHLICRKQSGEFKSPFYMYFLFVDKKSCTKDIRLGYIGHAYFKIVSQRHV